jgi:hypothetical protein
LFQAQPSGFPFITHKSTGLFVRALSPRDLQPSILVVARHDLSDLAVDARRIRTIAGERREPREQGDPEAKPNKMQRWTGWDLDGAEKQPEVQILSILSSC